MKPRLNVMHKQQEGRDTNSSSCKTQLSSTVRHEFSGQTPQLWDMQLHCSTACHTCCSTFLAHHELESKYIINDDNNVTIMIIIIDISIVIIIIIIPVAGGQAKGE